MRLLDLFCGAGGAAMGYHRAGFEVVGVDIRPQPRYPFEFHQADAMAYPLEGFDVIHASPPCQRFSSLTKMHGREQVESHPDLVQGMRTRLQETGATYVIENVPGAPLQAHLMLCGTMFGLRSEPYHLYRHRVFEFSVGVSMWAPAACAHVGLSLSVYGHPGGTSSRDMRKFGNSRDWRVGMGIDWMTNDELAESIPPAYTEYIGKALLAELEHRR